MLALPVWLYQLWRFITPALDRREKRYALPFVASSLVLFVLGAVVALLTLTEALSFLFGVGGIELQPLLTADKYLSLVSLMVIAFGLSFEFPVLIMFLLLARVVSTQQLRHWRRYAIVLLVAFAAVITPSADPFSMFAMAIPMYVFYESCIVHRSPAQALTRVSARRFFRASPSTLLRVANQCASTTTAQANHQETMRMSIDDRQLRVLTEESQDLHSDAMTTTRRLTRRARRARPRVDRSRAH